MAKKRGRKRSRLDAVAMAAGTGLGVIANQLDALNKNRNEISAQIRVLVRQAESKLKGMAANEVPLPRIAGRPKKAKKAAKKIRTMSAAARKKIAAAQKARWAKVKKAAKE